MAKKEKLSLEELLEQALVKDDDKPYEVPNNWVWTKLGACTYLRRGASPRPINAFITEAGDGVNWIRIGDANTGKYLNSTKFKITGEGAKKSVFLQKGSLILSNSMSFGRPYILDCDGCVHDGWLAITFYNNSINKEFLYYALLSSTWYFEQVAVGTAVRNLNIDRVAHLPISLPPLPEQQRIVNLIEYLFEKLDSAKEFAKKALDLFENRKSAILHKAFTGELTAKWREESGTISKKLTKIEEVPFEIPKEWVWLSLQELVYILGDGLHGTPNYSETGEYYFVNGNNLRDGRIEIKPVTKQVSTSEFLKYRKNFSTNTVLVSINGTLGNVAIYNNEQIVLGKSACYFNLMDNYNKFYIKYFLQTLFFKNYANSMATGSTIKNLSLKSMRNLPVPVPLLPEQQEVVRILDEMLENELRAKELCDVIDNIDLMKKSILARAFRGELSTNNPDEESALELLKEVLRERVEG